MKALTFLALGIAFLLSSVDLMAGAKMSDAGIKQELLGYWKSPRHGYHIAANGVMYMCPRKYATTTNRWDVKGGMFYQDGVAYRIVSLTNKKFIYGDPPGSYTLTRGTKEEVDPD